MLRSLTISRCNADVGLNGVVVLVVGIQFKEHAADRGGPIGVPRQLTCAWVNTPNGNVPAGMLQAAFPLTPF